MFREVNAMGNVAEDLFDLIWNLIKLAALLCLGFLAVCVAMVAIPVWMIGVACKEANNVLVEQKAATSTE